MDGLLGLGAWCYYGLGIYNQIGTIEKAINWPWCVKDRNHSKYTYLAGSTDFTALSTMEVKRTLLMNFMMRDSWTTTSTTFAAITGAGMWVQSLSYDQSPRPKAT